MKLKTLFLTPLLLFIFAYSVRITASDTNYGPVQPNDNLWVISGQHQAAQGSQLLKWMMAFYSANPDAFIKGNINLLRQGVTLRVPSLQQVESVDQNTALKTLVLHNVLLRTGNPVIPASTATSEEAQAITQRNAELLNRIQSLTAEMEGLKGRTTEQDRHVTDLKNQVSELQTQLSQAKAENADLKARVSGGQSAQNEAATLRKELEGKLQTRIQELEGLLSQSKTRAGELESNLKLAKEAQQTAASAKSEKEMQLEAQIVQLKAELAETKNYVQKLESQLKSAQQLAKAVPAPQPAPQPAAAVTATPNAQPVASPVDSAPAGEDKPWWQTPPALSLGLLGLLLMGWLFGRRSRSDSSSEIPAKQASGRGPSKEDEILTKLDMARAYVEMGNRASARAVLEEVLNEGNDKAKKKAKGMLAQLNAA